MAEISERSNDPMNNKTMVKIVFSTFYTKSWSYVLIQFADDEPPTNSLCRMPNIATRGGTSILHNLVPIFLLGTATKFCLNMTPFDPS